MSKGGHTLLAAAIGGASVLAGRDLALLGVVTAAAGRLPDSIEIVTGFSNGERQSILPHRTLSHSPLPVLGTDPCGAVAPAAWSAAGGSLIASLGLGGILHLAVDLLSLAGVSLGNPFGPRTSLGPYRSRRRASVSLPDGYG